MISCLLDIKAMLRKVAINCYIIHVIIFHSLFLYLMDEEGVKINDCLHIKASLPTIKLAVLYVFPEVSCILGCFGLW